MGKARKITGMILIIMSSFFIVSAQISPGDLSNPHAHLEGISNCTQCHDLGNKVSNDKCMACHKDIQERIILQKGYHASVDVKGKQCINCHNEHHGKNFQLIRLDAEKFDHNLTGYPLSPPHAKKKCNDCHDSKNITDQVLKNKKKTYLGLNTDCLTCHPDYHQKTLSRDCLNCHNPDAYVPATKFNHASAKFQLVGKHQNVDCYKCHMVEMVNGQSMRQFKGVQYENCTSCHKDPHQNQFGQNCRQCHTEESFHILKGINTFNHNTTKFRLEEKHLSVNCKSCHKGNFTIPLKHDRCTNCHTDYHNQQFVKNGISPDCALCHNVKGFDQFSYTVEQHNQGAFPLKGAHPAVPCNECHKKQENWSFRAIGMDCKDCHKDIHEAFIPLKYYPDANCKNCHKETQWGDVKFDHSLTRFDLTGAHVMQKCRACHFSNDSEGNILQKFTGLSNNCFSCHKDPHYKQFEKEGITDCAECHLTENWNTTRFDHNNAAFKLDGEHIHVSCNKCHTTQQDGPSTYVKYKLNEFKCESCHF